MELLQFMYSNKLTVTAAPALLDVLKVADKFLVASCIKHCSRLLRNLPMTPESVLVYLDLPSNVLMAKAFQPLTIAAKQFYAVHYKDITRYEDEIIDLPLASVEAILASDDLCMKSENRVFIFVLKWVEAHFRNVNRRHEIITTRLAKFIRYPYMSCRMLKEILLTCIYFKPEFTKKVVDEALAFKAKKLQHTSCFIDEYHWFVERAYEYKPVKMIEFDQPCPRCVVYMALKHEACASLFPSGVVYSEVFNFIGQRFNLKASCENDGFGLYCSKVIKEKESDSTTLDYEFAARLNPSEEFVRVFNHHYTFKTIRTVGVRNLFKIPWSSFIGEDSVYFIDGVLHLGVEISVSTVS